MGRLLFNLFLRGILFFEILSHLLKIGSSVIPFTFFFQESNDISEVHFSFLFDNLFKLLSRASVKCRKLLHLLDVSLLFELSQVDIVSLGIKTDDVLTLHLHGFCNEIFEVLRSENLIQLLNSSVDLGLSSILMLFIFVTVGCTSSTMVMTMMFSVSIIIFRVSTMSRM